MNTQTQNTALSLEEILFWWPSIIRRASNDWAKGFARSILKCSRRRNWQPTPKQLSIMRRMVSELFTHGNDDDFALIE